nr:uncharacterized protein LOC109152773 [Ipomoea batatas]
MTRNSESGGLMRDILEVGPEQTDPRPIEWKRDLKGQYMVKHGYNILVQQYMNQETGQLWSDMSAIYGETLIDLIQRCLCDSDGSKSLLMVARLWVIWAVRNDMLWNGKVWKLGEVE